MPASGGRWIVSLSDISNFFSNTIQYYRTCRRSTRGCQILRLDVDVFHCFFSTQLVGKMLTRAYSSTKSENHVQLARLQDSKLLEVKHWKFYFRPIYACERRSYISKKSIVSSNSDNTAAAERTSHVESRQQKQKAGLNHGRNTWIINTG
jgi:hypothetical protein